MGTTLPFLAIKNHRHTHGRADGRKLSFYELQFDTVALKCRCVPEEEHLDDA